MDGQPILWSTEEPGSTTLNDSRQKDLHHLQPRSEKPCHPDVT